MGTRRRDPDKTSRTLGYPSLQSVLNHAIALHRAGQLPAAERLCRQILETHPNHFESLYLLGVIFHQRGDYAGAVRQIDAALQVNPNAASAHCNRADALQELMRFDEAVASYDRAISLKPDYVQALYNRGIALKELMRFDEAVTSYDRAIALKPDHADALNNRGTVLRELMRFDEALASYDQALSIKPDQAEVFTNRGNVLRDLMRFDEAVASYEHALALKPDFAEAQFALCTAELRILYENEQEISARRSAYEKRLTALCSAADRNTHFADLANGVGYSLPFYLAYQGRNDRDLQALYGALVCRIMANKYGTPPMPPPPSPDAKVRIGIVSGMFRQHTVWKLMIRGWLSQLDRCKFEVFGYHTGAARDGQTQVAASECDRFVQGPLPGDRWREEILADRPHILIYPEIGMDSRVAWLAAHRLAPTQCVSWGHPTTSGYPTIDYFLSSALMESPEAEQHYTERLVRLPNLSIYYEPIDFAPVTTDRQRLGLRPSATAYWCGQSVFKYLPQFDEVFPRIAKQIGDCQFAFIASQQGDAVTEHLRRRFDRAFAALGLDAAKHCIFLPRLGQEQFIAAIGQCDVVLDSIGWSGGNTTLEGLAHDVPIATLAAPLMRGRHSMAILRMMGITETITYTIDDYVSAAVRLAQDAPWRMAIKRRISENKHRLYRDRTCISALEEFLTGVARRAA